MIRINQTLALCINIWAKTKATVKILTLISVIAANRDLFLLPLNSNITAAALLRCRYTQLIALRRT